MLTLKMRLWRFIRFSEGYVIFEIMQTGGNCNLDERDFVGTFGGRGVWDVLRRGILD